MIDLHCHILHGFDDGAHTFEESLEMARMAAADGIRTLVATPHSPRSFACRHYDPKLIQQRVDELNAALRKEDVPLEVIPGTEIAYDAGVDQQLKQGAILPYGKTRTVLFEPPYGALPPTFDVAIFTLQVAGYRVLLAHPERIPDVQNNPNRLRPLVERGVLMQITAAAITGGQGELLERVSVALLTHGMAHVLASDSHGPRSQRLPQLAAARDRAAALLNPQAADALVRDTPQRLLHNQAFVPPIPRRVDHRRWHR